MKKKFLITMLIVITTTFVYSKSKPIYVFLDPSEWECTLYGKTHRWSKDEINESKSYQMWIGSVRSCIRYERRNRV